MLLNLLQMILSFHLELAEPIKLNDDIIITYFIFYGSQTSFSFIKRIIRTAITTVYIMRNTGILKFFL
jgi:hypothetical protein